LLINYVYCDSPVETKVKNERVIESVYLSDNVMPMPHLCDKQTCNTGIQVIQSIGILMYNSGALYR